MECKLVIVCKYCINNFNQNTVYHVRFESSWNTCVAKMNEVLHRKYIPKGRQLQGFENVEDVNDSHGQSLNLPKGTEDMLGTSLSDMPTPTFEDGFGTNRQYLADADNISKLFWCQIFGDVSLYVCSLYF